MNIQEKLEWLCRHGFDCEILKDGSLIAENIKAEQHIIEVKISADNLKHEISFRSWDDATCSFNTEAFEETEPGHLDNWEKIQFEIEGW